MDRIGWFWRFQRVRTQKICEILWVIIKTMINENSAYQLTPNSNAVGNLNSKMEKAFPEALNGYFLLKIGILCVRDMKKHASLRHEVPGFGPAFSPSHNSVIIIHGFFENAWLYICYCTILNMFCIRLHSSLHCNHQNCPNLYIKHI